MTLLPNFFKECTDVYDQPETEDTPLRNHHCDNFVDPFNLDAQYLKSIKIDVPTFAGCHDPQLFLDWTLQLDRYTEPRKVNLSQ